MEATSSSTQTGTSGKKSILRGKMQREMAACFEGRGLLGLKKMLISIAEKHNDGKIASWKKFLEFATAKPGETDWVLFYLGNMDPEFLRALVSILYSTHKYLLTKVALRNRVEEVGRGSWV